MTPNNWLCKHFDSEQKGYVTIGDIIMPIVSCVVSMVFVLFAVLSGIMVVGIAIFAASPEPSIYDQSSATQPDIKQLIFICAYGWLIFIKYVIIPVAVIMCVWWGCSRLSKIKIAKCERKQEDEKSLI